MTIVQNYDRCLLSQIGWLYKAASLCCLVAALLKEPKFVSRKTKQVNFKTLATVISVETSLSLFGSRVSQQKSKCRLSQFT